MKTESVSLVSESYSPPVPPPLEHTYATLTFMTQGLKRQLKALKAAYDEASHARYDQTRNASTSWDSPLELLKNSPPPAAGAATEGSGSVGAGGGSSPASISLTGVHSRLARRRFSSRYSLLVGDDVEVLEEKFSGTLDAEVLPFRSLISSSCVVECKEVELRAYVRSSRVPL